MSRLKNWIEGTHRLGYQKLLNDKFESMECPQLRANLMPHQKLALKAMSDLEQTQTIRLTIGKTAETTSAVYSDKYGSGKTFVLMALLCGTKIKDRPEVIINTALTDDYYIESTVIYKYLTHTNLIFVGPSVLKQWEDCLTAHTNLRTLVISGYLDFKKMYKKLQYSTDILSQYDVILIKNGTMNSKNFGVDCPELVETPLMKRQMKSIISVMFEISMLWGIKWHRVVLDDFDVIKVHSESQFIPARFTWFVSASSMSGEIKILQRKGADTVDMVRYARPTYLTVTRDNILFKTLNIRNNPIYMNSCIELCPIIAKHYIAINPNKKYIDVIDTLAGGTKEIMDMLNSGAIKTASEHIGIVANSESEIFEKLLDKSYSRYKILSKELEKLREAGDEILSLPTNPKVLSASKFNKLLKSGTFTHNNVNLRELIDDKIRQLEEEKYNIELPINRVLENLKHGNCPICFGKISDHESRVSYDGDEDEEKEDALIMNCCNVIICQNCMSSSTKLSNRDGDITGSCPNCRAEIRYAEAIYLSKDLNVEKLGFDAVKLLDLSTKEAPSDDMRDFSKLDILTSILLQDGRYPGKEHKLESESLLGGEGKLPKPTGNIKTVIYSRYDESILAIENHLNSLGIEYLILGGSAKRIDNTVNTFKKSIDVLLVNGEKYCAGLNLQFADQLIFLHRFTSDGKIDADIEEQIIGRLQRHGRKTQLCVHYIVYKNESRN